MVWKAIFSIEDQVFLLIISKFWSDQFVWLSNIVADVEWYFKLKKYILPHVESEKCSI